MRMTAQQRVCRILKGVAQELVRQKTMTTAICLSGRRKNWTRTTTVRFITTQSGTACSISPVVQVHTVRHVSEPSHQSPADAAFEASPPVGGEDNEDITSFIACSATWGRERANRPPSLSLWMPPPSQNNPNYDVEALTYKNRLVLDWKGDLIRRFIELPATISSNVEGWRTEAWVRNDPRVTYGDIVARMRTKEGAHGRVPIFDNRALATRTSNFRDHAGSVSWRDRASQARYRAFMDNLRTPAQRANNMTTDLDLTPAQRAAFYSMSRKLVSRRVTAGNAVPSTSSNVAGSSKPGASRSHGKATNRSATESDVPTLSAPTQYFDLTMISEQSQQGSSEIEAGEHSEHARYDNSRDEEVLETYPIYEGEEEAEWPFEFFETGDSDDPSSNSSISSGPDNPNDARNHIPEGMSEAMMLRAALVATVDHFRRLTGQYPVTTDPMENNLSQWAAYHYQLATFLRAQGRNDNQITLFGLAEWVGGISNWKSARPAIDEGTQENEGL